MDGGDGGVAFGAAQAKQAQAWHQRDAGQGIEFLLGTSGMLVVPRKIVAVATDERAHSFAGRMREAVELAGVRMRQDQRPVFGADGVVGRDHAAFG